MFKVNDHKTRRLFDPWNYLGPKRSKLLETGWAVMFRKYLLDKLPVLKQNRHMSTMKMHSSLQ